MAFGEMTVTLQDCQMMLGLRIRGRAVTGLCRSEGWRAWVEAFLGREVGEQGARTSGVLISWLRAEFAQCPPGGRRPDSSVLLQGVDPTLVRLCSLPRWNGVTAS
jgi:hypothetical protein